jgi:hypothetical protein
MPDRLLAAGTVERALVLSEWAPDFVAQEAFDAPPSERWRRREYMLRPIDPLGF